MPSDPCKRKTAWRLFRWQLKVLVAFPMVAKHACICENATTNSLDGGKTADGLEWHAHCVHSSHDALVPMFDGCLSNAKP